MTTNAIKRVGFLGNRIQLYQQEKGGHRPGLDAALLASTVPDIADGPMADFGAGNGAVGLSVLARCGSVSMTLIERDTESRALIDAALADPDNASVTPRAHALSCDVTDHHALRVSGIMDGSLSAVLMNPPYNTEAHRSSPDAARAAAHQSDNDTFRQWLTAAHIFLAHNGSATIIARPENLPAILTALENRFGGAVIFPVFPRRNAPASRLLVKARKGSRARLTISAGLVLHNDDGSWTSQADAILRGDAALSLDG